MVLRHLPLLLLVLLVLILPAPLWAQSDVVIADLRLQIWPEFDQPEVLLIWDGVVAAETALPTDLRFQLPAGTRLHAVAYSGPSGLVNAEYRQEGETLILSTPNGTFHVEAYDSSLRIEGRQRAYRLDWLALHPVEAFLIEVEAPLGARAVQIQPEPVASFEDPDGFRISAIQESAVAVGQSLTVELRYRRSTDTLSADLLASGDRSAGGLSLPPSTALLIGMGLTGLAVLLGLGVAALVRARRQGAETGEAEIPSRETRLIEPPPDEVLTSREIEVLGLLAEGLTGPQIAGRLNISPKTVARHRENMMEKLGMRSRTELVKYALRHRLVENR